MEAQPRNSMVSTMTMCRIIRSSPQNVLAVTRIVALQRLVSAKRRGRGKLLGVVAAAPLPLSGRGPRRLGSETAAARAIAAVYGYAAADKVGHQRRQPLVLTAEPVVLHRNVLAFDVAGFAQALADDGPRPIAMPIGLSQYPLRSESDRSAALPRSVAMCQNRP